MLCFELDCDSAVDGISHLWLRMVGDYLGHGKIEEGWEFEQGFHCPEEQLIAAL